MKAGASPTMALAGIAAEVLNQANKTHKTAKNADDNETIDADYVEL